MAHFLFSCSACWNCWAKLLMVIKRVSSQSSDEPGGGREQRTDNDRYGVPFQTAILCKVRHELVDQITYQADRDEDFIFDSRHAKPPTSWRALWRRRCFLKGVRPWLSRRKTARRGTFLFHGRPFGL